MSRASPLPNRSRAAEIQASLDDRSVLLQYALGSPKSFVWVVTRSSLQVVELADRATIESAARRVYEDLKTYRPDGSSSELTTPLDDLAALILAPVVPFMGSDKERLIIAADGALGYIPFGVLPLPRAGESTPLLADVGGQQRAFDVGRSGATAAHGAGTAQRLSPCSRTRYSPRRIHGLFRVITPAALSPNPRRALRLRLERLPATGAEAAAIAALVAPDSRLVVTGFGANREQVLNAPLSDYRIVHFATHGLVDSRYPGLSALAFSQFDAAGQPLNGLLRLQDVYRLNLNADFVVLSGCETALGREIRGEGLIGLVDGFLYAGARNLVVSLWQVPDRATAELMTRFYGYVLRDALRPAEALRRAQRSIAAEQRWSDPYFWGAFVVLGDS